MRASDVGRSHEGFHVFKALRSAPPPQRNIHPTTVSPRLSDAMHELENVDRVRRNRHAAVARLPALLEGQDRDGLLRQINTTRCKRERLADPAARVVSTRQNDRTSARS